MYPHRKFSLAVRGATPMEIDIRVTPSLHPDRVLTADNYDDHTKAVLDPVAGALRTAYEGVKRVHLARDKARLNPTWNEAAQAIHTQELADKVFANVAKKIDGTRAALLKQVASFEDAMTRPIQSRAVAPIAAEVRAHFKTLPAEKRHEAIMQAIDEDDHTVATAVLGAPAMLSGFAPKMQDALIRRYHARNSPVEAKRLKAAQESLTLIETAGPLLFGQMEKAVGMPPQKVYALKKARDEAEQAFILRSEP